MDRRVQASRRAAQDDIVSHHIADVLYDDGKDAMVPVPAAIVQFEATQ